MKRREFLVGAASVAFGVTSATEILLGAGNARGKVELIFKDAESLKGLSGKKLRNALADQLIIRSEIKGKASGRLVMFRVVKGEIKDQFVSDLLKLSSGEMLVPGDMFIPGEMYVPSEMFIPGDMYVPGNMYVPGDMFKEARESARQTLEDGSGFFFIVMAETKRINNKGGALPTE